MKKEEMKAAIEVIKAIADAIKELGSVPSGHLYAQVMGHLSLDQYNRVIDILKSGGFVTEENYLLTWIG